MFRPLYRSEIRYYTRFRRIVPAVLFGALVDFSFQTLNGMVQRSFTSPVRSMRILQMLCDPLVWFAAWITWYSVTREYKTKRAEEMKLSFLTSKEMFGPKYWTLVIFLLLVVALSLSISWPLQNYFFYGSTGLLAAFPRSLLILLNWVLLAGYYPVLLSLGAPVVVWFVMIAFPRSARQGNGFLLSGLLLQGMIHGSFYAGMMTLILLTARYNVWPKTFLPNPILNLQLCIVAVPLPILALGALWIRPRFTRILDLPKE